MHISFGLLLLTWKKFFMRGMKLSCSLVNNATAYYIFCIGQVCQVLPRADYIHTSLLFSVLAEIRIKIFSLWLREDIQKKLPIYSCFDSDDVKLVSEHWNVAKMCYNKL